MATASFDTAPVRDAAARPEPGVRGHLHVANDDLFAPREDLVRVLDHDRELLDGLDERTADLARRRVAVPRMCIDQGPWTPPDADECGDALGLLVLDGHLVRSIRLAGRDCPELLGPGDLIKPWEDQSDGASVEHVASWCALDRVTVAVLDQRFAGVVARLPTVMARIMARSVERSRRLAFTFAIAHVRRAEMRLLMLLWHLADRWGRVTPSGVHVPVRLTHELMAHLACMRRPTASTALHRLELSGEVVRRSDGSWLLTGAPPAYGPDAAA